MKINEEKIKIFINKKGKIAKNFSYLLLLLISISFPSIIVCSDRPEKDVYIQKLNGPSAKDFQALFKGYDLYFKEITLTFCPESVKEEEKIQSYAIIYSNITVEMFFKFDITPDVNDSIFEEKLKIEDKLGYGVLHISQLILKETSEKYFNYTEEISSLNYTLDDTESFLYFNEIGKSDYGSHVIESIWKTHLEQVLLYYPEPNALKMMRTMIYLLKYYKEFPVFGFNGKSNQFSNVIVHDITFVEFFKNDFYSGTFYDVEFNIEYNEEKHKILYGIAYVSTNIFELINLKKGDYVEDYVCSELAKIALDLYAYS